MDVLSCTDSGRCRSTLCVSPFLHRYLNLLSHENFLGVPCLQYPAPDRVVNKVSAKDIHVLSNSLCDSIRITRLNECKLATAVNVTGDEVQRISCEGHMLQSYSENGPRVAVGSLEGSIVFRVASTARN